MQHARKRAEVAETSAAAAAPTAAPKPMGSGKASEDTPKVKARDVWNRVSGVDVGGWSDGCGRMVKI